MPVSSIFSRGTVEGDVLDTGIFATIVFSIIFGWILVSNLQRFLENLCFQTLGLNSLSTVQTLMIFIVLFIVFIAFIWMIDAYQFVPASQAGAGLQGAAEGLLPDTPTTSNNASSSVTNTLSNPRRGHPIVINPRLNVFN